GGGIALHLDFLLCGLDQRRADRVAVGRPGVAFEEAQLRPHQLALLGREGAGLPDPCCVLPPLVAGETHIGLLRVLGDENREQRLGLGLAPGRGLALERRPAGRARWTASTPLRRLLEARARRLDANCLAVDPTL